MYSLHQLPHFFWYCKEKLHVDVTCIRNSMLKNVYVPTCRCNKFSTRRYTCKTVVHLTSVNYRQYFTYNDKQCIQFVRGNKRISCVPAKDQKVISSPYCTLSKFVFIFVLNFLIHYTSLMAYRKFFSPLLQVIWSRNAPWAETSVWNNAEVLLLVIIVEQGYLALIY